MSDREIMDAKNPKMPSTQVMGKRDPFVQVVKNKFESRSQVGIKKYDTTLERTDLSINDWLTHAQEEAMDLTLYLERIMYILEERGLDEL